MGEREKGGGREGRKRGRGEGGGEGGRERVRSKGLSGVGWFSS